MLSWGNLNFKLVLIFWEYYFFFAAVLIFCSILIFLIVLKNHQFYCTKAATPTNGLNHLILKFLSDKIKLPFVTSRIRIAKTDRDLDCMTTPAHWAAVVKIRYVSSHGVPIIPFSHNKLLMCLYFLIIEINSSGWKYRPKAAWEKSNNCRWLMFHLFQWSILPSQAGREQGWWPDVRRQDHRQEGSQGERRLFGEWNQSAQKVI